IMAFNHAVRCLSELYVGTRWSTRSGKLAPQPGGNRSGEMLGCRFGEIVERDQALSEPVAAAPPRQDQRHRGGGDRAVIVADEALQDPRPAPSAARARGGRDSLLVRASQKQGHEPDLVEQPRGG